MPSAPGCVLQSPHTGNGGSRTAPRLLDLKPRGLSPAAQGVLPMSPQWALQGRPEAYPVGGRRQDRGSTPIPCPLPSGFSLSRSGGAPRGRACARAERLLCPMWFAGAVARGKGLAPCSRVSLTLAGLALHLPRKRPLSSLSSGRFPRTEAETRMLKAGPRGSLWNRAAHLSPSHRGPAPSGKWAVIMGLQPRPVWGWFLS